MRHKSREGAITIDRCIQHRIRKAKLSAVQTYFDCTNDFMTISVTTIAELLPRFIDTAFLELAQQRLAQSSYVLQTPDGAVSTFSSQGKGVLPGDPFAAGSSPTSG